MKTRIISLILALFIVLGMMPVANAASHPFTDVPSNQWYAEYVQYVYDKGLMSGTSATAFNPTGTMTRAMTVTVLYRLAGSPEVTGTNPFQDVPAGKWYTNAVIWAASNKITSGTSATTFAPNNKVTREQLVTFLYRYAAFMDGSLVEGDFASLSKYSDAGRVSSYATAPFRWAVSTSIITGTDATHLSPTGSATRAQCATILCRFDRWMNAAPHEHSYTAAETVAPTCTETGYTVFKCSCGDNYKGNEVAATGHNYTSITEGSTTTYTCQSCGHTYNETIDVDSDEFKREVARYIAQYINQYRNEQGSRTCEVLPGMTLVAEYRADQLTTNFAHDVKDIRAAHAYYEYGEYIDATLFGDPAENSYWTSHSIEANGYVTVPSSDADYIGQRLATACRNSASHWGYVGDNSYSYIAVGVEYSNETWYCCIMVNNHNYG